VVEVVRDGVDGILAPVGDADGVADGMLRILCDATLRAAVVASARERVAAFSGEAMVEDSLGAYRRALYSARC
jgi:glycosyltransferase involved in cell wall biosynthesis